MSRFGLRVYRQLRSRGIGGDLLLLAVLVCVLLPVAYAVSSAGVVQVDRVLTVLSVAAIAGAGILLALTGQLSKDPVSIRIASALIVCGMVVLPIGVMQPADLAGDSLQLTRQVAVVAVAVLFALSLRRDAGPDRAWPAAAVATAAVLVTGGAAGLAPNLVPTGPALLALLVLSLVTTVFATVALVIVGIRRRNALMRSTGLAMFAGYAARGLREVDLPPLDALVLSSAVRAAGVAILLLAVIRFSVTTLRALSEHQEAAEARLRAAELAAATVADREHEMRNVVAGLSGAVAVLYAGKLPAGSADREQLEAAARAELDRLRRMLERDPGKAPQPAAGPADVPVRPLLGNLVAVHRASGAAIESSVPDGLRAAVPAEVLAQVVTNLLVNCARHAPGAQVRVTARRHGGRVLIEIADDGPGVPHGATRIFERGVRSARSRGSGLGLAISTDLLAEHGGSLRVERAVAGCTVVVDVPERSEPSVVRAPQPAFGTIQVLRRERAGA